jgi:hypothetical protein
MMSKMALWNLLGLCALSMAAAACSGDSSSGTGGEGGTGGTPGPLVDQCVDEPDAGYVQSGALSAAAQMCGQGTCLEVIVKLIGGNATEADEAAAVECIRECVLQDSSVEGVSTGCAQCFGNSSACGASAQCNVCIAPDSCKCVDCLDVSGCQEEIDICTGVIRDFECTGPL